MRAPRHLSVPPPRCARRRPRSAPGTLLALPAPWDPWEAPGAGSRRSASRRTRRATRPLLLDHLQSRYFRTVSLAPPDLVDARIAAGAAHVPRHKDLEDLAHRYLTRQMLQDRAPRVQLDDHRLAGGGQGSLRVCGILDQREQLLLARSQPILKPLACCRGDGILVGCLALIIRQDLLVAREAPLARQRKHLLGDIVIRHHSPQMRHGRLVAADRLGDQFFCLTLDRFGPRVGGVDVLPDKQSIDHVPERGAAPRLRHIDTVTGYTMPHTTPPANGLHRH